MPFEYDPNKSASNKQKHGIDFEEAQELWADPNRVEFDASYVDEPRILVVGKAQGKMWTAVMTYHLGNIRIVSVRRARKNEVKLYEEDWR